MSRVKKISLNEALLLVRNRDEAVQLISATLVSNQMESTIEAARLSVEHQLLLGDVRTHGNPLSTTLLPLLATCRRQIQNCIDAQLTALHRLTEESRRLMDSLQLFSGQNMTISQELKATGNKTLAQQKWLLGQLETDMCKKLLSFVEVATRHISSNGSEHNQQSSSSSSSSSHGQQAMRNNQNQENTIENNNHNHNNDNNHTGKRQRVNEGVVDGDGGGEVDDEQDQSSKRRHVATEYAQPAENSEILGRIAGEKTKDKENDEMITTPTSSQTVFSGAGKDVSITSTKAEFGTANSPRSDSEVNHGFLSVNNDDISPQI